MEELSLAVLGWTAVWLAARNRKSLASALHAVDRLSVEKGELESENAYLRRRLIGVEKRNELLELSFPPQPKKPVRNSSRISGRASA